MVEPISGPEPGGASPAGAGDPPKSESTSPVDVLMKVLGAIGAGIGVLSFVAFVGGAILWVRAEESNLPGTEAVAVIPNSVLVSTGATYLAPAALIAIRVVLSIVVVHLVFRLPREKQERGRSDKVKELMRRAEATGRDAAVAVESAKTALSFYGSLQEQLHAARTTPELADAVPGLERLVEERREETERLEQAAQYAVSAAATAKANAETLAEEVEAELERTNRQIWWECGVGAVVLMVPPLVNGAIFKVGAWGLLLAGLAVAVILISLFVYLETEKFFWFGVTAFAAVGAYLGCATFINTSQNPKLQPVAALRTGHEPVTGSFLADTSSNLYVGTFEEAGRPPHLLVIPRTQVTELTIGPLLDPGTARKRAIAMALEECEQKVEAPAHGTGSGEASQIEPACGPQQIEDLKGAAEG